MSATTPATTAAGGFPAEDITAWRGQDVLDPAGDKLGKLEELYYDGETDAPMFIAVKSGLVGKKLTLVPLAGATVSPDYVRVAHDKKQVKDAPDYGTDVELTVEDETATYGYFGVPYTPMAAGSRRLAKR